MLVNRLRKVEEKFSKLTGLCGREILDLQNEFIVLAADGPVGKYLGQENTFVGWYFLRVFHLGFLDTPYCLLTMSP